jgi:outer membrane lipoprotein-sorting protein
MMTLDQRIESLRNAEPREEDVRGAQSRLEAALARAPKQRQPAARRVGWLTAGASAAAAAIAALVFLPLAPNTALAFAQVQDHFRHFKTLVFDVQQTLNGDPLMSSRVSVREDGSVRTEVGDDITVVVNMREQRVMVLSKASRTAVISPLDVAGRQEDAVDWIQEIRDFQGAATRLPETRVIDGVTAIGWKLEIAGSELVLWADSNGLPLEMQLDQGMNMNMRFHFEFNAPLSDALFSTAIPPGYSRAESED